MDFPKKVYTVSELTLTIRTILEQEFPLIWIKGEISNLSRPGSGHIYFSLKDQSSVISAVWFKSNHNLGQNLSPDSLKNGMSVLCAGKISVYSQRGTYQLIVEFIEDVGIGNLYIELEMLKRKLAKKGYFDASKKKSIPRNPKRVGVITALSGAAIQDFLRVAKERGMDHTIRIYPSLVQGENAPEEIAKMIEIANLENWSEVLVLIRGGGSFEDIHVFNSEIVADAIFRSKIPVVTGIGHEIDYTIADMVADYRCATPTYVADFLWDPRDNYIQMLDTLTSSLSINIHRYIKLRIDKIKGYLDQFRAFAPKRKLKNLEYTFFNLVNSMEAEVRDKVQRNENKLNQLIYRFHIQFNEILNRASRDFIYNTKELNGIMSKKLDRLEKDIDLLANMVNERDPKRPINRGYCLVRTLDGKVVVSAKDIEVGDKVGILFKDGERIANIIS